MFLVLVQLLDPVARLIHETSLQKWQAVRPSRWRLGALLCVLRQYLSCVCSSEEAADSKLILHKLYEYGREMYPRRTTFTLRPESGPT